MRQSNRPMPVVGLMLLCHLDGTLRSLLWDDVGLGTAFIPGRAFTSLLDPGSLHKGLTFLATLHTDQAIDDWELQMLLENKPHTMHMRGRVTPEGLLIVAAPWGQHLEHLCATVAVTAADLTDASRLQGWKYRQEGDSPRRRRRPLRGFHPHL